MAGKTLKRIVGDIKSLRVQGASNVRNSVIKAVVSEAGESRANDINSFRKGIKEAMLMLARARPTEPDTRTALRILLKALNAPANNADGLRRHVIGAANSYHKDRDKALEAIARYGAREIPKASVVFTHCHSHTVEEILKKAWREKRIKGVIATETRPRFQGHITAENLTRAGIPVTLIVDSAARIYMQKADVFITGCDAILSDGSIVNKVGTSLISLAAKQTNVPHYVATSSHSFDPITVFGEREVIEMRSEKEIWEKKMRRLKIENPAFDITEPDLVRGIICEKGVFSPGSFVNLMYGELGLAGKSEKDFSLIHMLKSK